MRNIFLTLSIAVIILSSCATGRVLEKTEYIVIEKSSVQIRFDGSSRKYYNRDNQNTYFNDYYNELVNRLGEYNIKVVSSGSGSSTGGKTTEQSGGNNSGQTGGKTTENTGRTGGGTYVLKIEQVTYNESYSTETVYPDSDATVPVTYQVTSCDVNVKLHLRNSDNSRKKLSTIVNANANKSEKLSNNRTFWQLIFGSNKDKSQYTYREMSKDVFSDLSKNAARETAAKVSKELYKNQQ